MLTCAAKSVVLIVWLVAISQINADCEDWTLGSDTCALLYEHHDCLGAHLETEIGATRDVPFGWNDM